MNFVFLVYVSRSGSTFVAKNLAKHSRELVVLPEFRLLDILMAEGDAKIRSLPADKLAAVMRQDHQIESLGLAPGELEEIAAACAGKGIRALLETLVERYIARRAPDRAGATTALIKLGSVVFIADEIQRVVPEAKFLHVYRDPRAVASSTLQSTRPYFQGQPMGRGDPIYIGQRYVDFVRAAQRLATRAPVCQVQYERFCTEPDAQVASIADFFAVDSQREAIAPSFEVAPAERDIHKLVDKPPVLERISAWQTELEPWAGVAIERTVGSLLDELGYEPFFLRAVTPARARWLGARAQLEHVRRTVEHLMSRATYYRTRPGLLGNRVKLALRRRARA